MGTLWADDGSLGNGFIHQPEWIAHIVTYSTPSVSFGRPDGKNRPCVALIAPLDGKPAHGHTSGPRDFDGLFLHNEIADALNGHVFRSIDSLADALVELGFKAVITTVSGGTYYRIR